MIKLDKKLGLGNLSCKVCGQRYQTGINCRLSVLALSQYVTDCGGLPDLSAAVDVYSDWVDACDTVAKDAANRYEEDDTRGAARLRPVPTEQSYPERG